MAKASLEPEMLILCLRNIQAAAKVTLVTLGSLMWRFVQDSKSWLMDIVSMAKKGKGSAGSAIKLVISEPAWPYCC